MWNDNEDDFYSENTSIRVYADELRKKEHPLRRMPLTLKERLLDIK